jgi:hypothetical protein
VLEIHQVQKSRASPQEINPHLQIGNHVRLVLKNERARQFLIAAAVSKVRQGVFCQPGEALNDLQSQGRIQRGDLWSCPLDDFNAPVQPALPL